MSRTLVDRIDSKETESPTVQSILSEDVHPTEFAPQTNGSKKKKILLGTFALTGVVLVMGAFWMIAVDFSKPDQSLIFYTVKRADLAITVTETGNLESQNTTDIRSELENVSYDRSGSSGTQIIFIVPNGKMVTAGELLVELDSAPVNDRLDAQVLATERATSEQIQADVKWKNQITQNKTLLAEAELRVQLSELDLKQYEDEDGGTFQIDLQDIDLAIQQAQAQRLITTTDLKGITALKKLGYRGKGELEKARVTALANDRSLAKELSRRKELVDYTYKKKKLELEGAVATAARSLEQAKLDNVALLAQAKAAKDAADRSLIKEEEKLSKYTKQLEKCKIVAPHDGMATYAVASSRYSRSSSTIAEGALVRERQNIITLPDLSRMHVQTAVHESVLHHIHEGLRATITVETFSDKKFKGTVKSVAVLPDPGGWMSSDIKIYKTIVTIDGEVSELKPGMTAIIDIHVDRLKDVLSIPVQAIVQIERENWCYIETSSGIERRELTLGRTNDKFIEIREGLNEGDRVVLNPMAIVDEAEDRQAVILPEDDSVEVSDEDEMDSSSSNEKGGSQKDNNQSRFEANAKSKQADTKGKSNRKKGAGGKKQRGSFDLMQYDKNDDGKVSVSDELPERMQRFMGGADSNSDGFIDSKEVAAMQNRSRSQRPTKGQRTPNSVRPPN
jgi:HlyD family secretion protein